MNSVTALNDVHAASNPLKTPHAESRRHGGDLASTFWSWGAEVVDWGLRKRKQIPQNARVNAAGQFETIKTTGVATGAPLTSTQKTLTNDIPSDSKVKGNPRSTQIQCRRNACKIDRRTEVGHSPQTLT